MKQVEPKLSDMLEYFASMSTTLAEAARIHEQYVLAHLFDMAAEEAKLRLEAIDNKEGTLRSAT